MSRDEPIFTESAARVAPRDQTSPRIKGAIDMADDFALGLGDEVDLADLGASLGLFGAASTDTDWGSLDLCTERHAVHRVEPTATGEQEYIISNLKKFDVTLLLIDRLTNLPATQQSLKLRATLVYENSQPVRAAPDEKLLEGDVEKVLNGPGSRMDGRCVMQLKLGPRALSQQHDRQRFRIKIAPADPQLATAYPTLTQLTEPVKSVTKLVRDVSGREPFFSLFAAAVC